MVTLRHVTIIMMPMVMLMAMMKTMVTSSVSDPKRRRSKGMAATRSIINQPLVNNIIVILIVNYLFKTKETSTSGKKKLTALIRRIGSQASL